MTKQGNLVPAAHFLSDSQIKVPLISLYTTHLFVMQQYTTEIGTCTCA